MKIKCIYLRTNLVNGKQYVGQTNDFNRREKVLINIYISVSDAVKDGFSWGGVSSASNGHLNKEGNHTYKGYEWFKTPL